MLPGMRIPESRNVLELDELLSGVPCDEDKDIAWSTPKSKDDKCRCEKNMRGKQCLKWHEQTKFIYYI